MITYDRSQILTVSSVKQFQLCPLAFDLTYHRPAVPAVTSPEARRGLAVHAALALHATDPDIAWIDIEDDTIGSSPEEDTEELTALFEAVRERYGSPPVIIPDGATNVIIEQSVVFDTDGNITVGAGGSFGGTPDLMFREGPVVTVRDYKTGHAWDGTELNRDRQMRFYAFIATKLYQGAETIRLERDYLRYEQGLQRAEYPAAQFANVWDDVVRWCRPIFEAMESGTFEAKPHNLCPWCSARFVCTAWKTCLETVGDIQEIKTDTDARQAVKTIDAAAARIKEIRANLEAHVNQSGPINDGGRAWGMSVNRRREIDSGAVIGAAIAQGIDIRKVAKIGCGDADKLLKAYPDLEEAIKSATKFKPQIVYGWRNQ